MHEFLDNKKKKLLNLVYLLSIVSLKLQIRFRINCNFKIISQNLLNCLIKASRLKPLHWPPDILSSVFHSTHRTHVPPLWSLGSFLAFMVVVQAVAMVVVYVVVIGKPGSIVVGGFLMVLNIVPWPVLVFLCYPFSLN